MSEKKNIDRLFQEKFKDFEANPPEFIWDNIREELEEKKKRRVVPIWIRLSGVAAIVVVGLLRGLFFSNGNTGTTNNPVVLDNASDKPAASPFKTLPTDKSSGHDINSGNVYDRSNRPTVNDNIVVDANKKDTKNNNGYDNAGNGKTVKSETEDASTIPFSTPAKNAVVYGTKNNKANSTNTTGIVTQPGKAVVSNTSFKNNNGSRNGGAATSASGKIANPDTYKQNNAVANNQSATAKNKAALNKGNKGRLNNNAGQLNNSAVANNTPPAGNNTLGKATSNNGTALNNLTQNNNAVAGNAAASVKNNSSNNNNNTAIATTETDKEVQPFNNAVIPPVSINKDVPLTEAAIAATDTVKPENELEKLLREKEAGKKEEKALAENAKTNKWNVKPQLAPVFYNSLSQGSPIDGQFAGNAKSYENDLSYGVGVNYAVSKKITIRSGVNTLNLNYETQGVEFYASLNKSTTNVAARTNGNIVVQNQGTGSNATPNAFNENQMPAGTFNGSMMQKTGYVEVPVEMAYALLDKKFGIDIIGGVSTLFLNDNNVSVVSNQGYATNVGQAQNLNSIHFSTNIGVGFKYRFFKSFEANFEPMFKYQVNTFSRDSGNFKPYFIGLYSGISFSF